MVSIIETGEDQQQNIQRNNNNNYSSSSSSGSGSSSNNNMSSPQELQLVRSGTGAGSAVSERSVELEISSAEPTHSHSTTPSSSINDNNNDMMKRQLKLDLVNPKTLDNYVLRSPKSPLSLDGRARLPHQTSITQQVEAVEDRKTLRDALYQGIFHRHRKTIFAMGSFLRMLRSRNSQYNTIRSTDPEDVEDTR